MIDYTSVQNIIEEATKSGKLISEIVLADQAEQLDLSETVVYERMRDQFTVMKDSIKNGLIPGLKSASGLSGGDACKLMQAVNEGRIIGGEFFGKILVHAIAVSEVNACMGKIVAAPTAGSCGIIPAVLITVMEEKNIPEKKVVMSLFTSSAIGMVIAKNASLSGAEGGCQAECGSASAMAAAALVEISGGTPEQCGEATGVAIKNILGLVCDPVAGLVEVPCIKRNALGAANAVTAANIALAGIVSVIPVDEVILAMKNVGLMMPPALKETARGGLADTPTARRLTKEIFGQ